MSETRRLLQADDDSDDASMSPPRSRRIAADSDVKSMCSLTAIYFLVMVVNGGLIGALGPSLEPIGRATGLHDAALARLVLQNRLCKFVGNLIWCSFARRLQQSRGVGRPHALFGGLMLVTTSSAITIGYTTQSTSLQLALWTWGLAYGITDAGVTTLTVWRWGDDNRRRRIDVSVLNAGFTVGALLAPTLVVASLRFGVGRWAFYAIAGISLITAFLLGLQRPMPLPISPKDGRSSPKITRAADRLLIQTSHSGGHAARAQLSQRRYERGFILAMSIILICVTACEHGIATWLSPLGVESGGLTEQRMALITSFYWAVMCAGRLLWAAMSGCVSSTWPMLFFDVGTCLFAALLLVGAQLMRFAFEPLLWLSSMAMGLGVSSAVPCVYSLVPEAHVKMTPLAITLLNAASTCGETAAPYIVGLAFGQHQYWFLGTLTFCSTAVAVLVATVARRQAERHGWTPRHPSDHEY